MHALYEAKPRILYGHILSKNMGRFQETTHHRLRPGSPSYSKPPYCNVRPVGKSTDEDPSPTAAGAWVRRSIIFESNPNRLTSTSLMEISSSNLSCLAMCP
ncbi:hypothetical protein V6N13_092239 [Hibiscus sabdariffa]|uniref:Uncharacterized protein n=1 Tax=Hibiscus sabdariffa TaxID=183260 RepID=A0ABR2CBS7_9ROSI